ncbi:uncharacterized protein LAESUDRAFT_91142 [Laetiporus sulphureus 93-53]|uniref:Uncharacterized protein n=1 Tax=Laetiporus sulphureus 93-53 TaxID=1314785 RepID=A0A165EYI3_9APHY|nr:uncharacterized protein LAESUDRAFT_91142 [Laetiporus sulphureus 93-53]KZT07984.1 hypothetical protein LAESUDRAFT_91142 [Laetiporus sulphureus 93-53]
MYCTAFVVKPLSDKGTNTLVNARLSIRVVIDDVIIGQTEAAEREPHKANFWSFEDVIEMCVTMICLMRCRQFRFNSQTFLCAIILC